MHRHDHLAEDEEVGSALELLSQPLEGGLLVPLPVQLELEVLSGDGGGSGGGGLLLTASRAAGSRGLGRAAAGLLPPPLTPPAAADAHRDGRGGAVCRGGGVQSERARVQHLSNAHIASHG